MGVIQGCRVLINRRWRIRNCPLSPLSPLSSSSPLYPSSPFSPFSTYLLRDKGILTCKLKTFAALYSNCSGNYTRNYDGSDISTTAVPPGVIQSTGVLKHTTILPAISARPSIAIINSPLDTPLSPLLSDKQIHANRRRDISILKDEIDAILPDKDVCHQELYENFVKNRLQDCNSANIARFMRLSGKKSKSNSPNKTQNESQILLKLHLKEFAKRISYLPSNSWGFIHISFVLYGLQGIEFKGGHDGVREHREMERNGRNGVRDGKDGDRDGRDEGYSDILLSMTRALRCSLRGRDEITAQSVSLMLYGLQRNSCESESSRGLLTMITGDHYHGEMSTYSLCPAYLLPLIFPYSIPICSLFPHFLLPIILPCSRLFLLNSFVKQYAAVDCPS